MQSSPKKNEIGFPERGCLSHFFFEICLWVFSVLPVLYGECGCFQHFKETLFCNSPAGDGMARLVSGKKAARPRYEVYLRAIISV